MLEFGKSQDSGTPSQEILQILQAFVFVLFLLCGSFFLCDFYWFFIPLFPSSACTALACIFCCRSAGFCCFICSSSLALMFVFVDCSYLSVGFVLVLLCSFIVWSIMLYLFVRCTFTAKMFLFPVLKNNNACWFLHFYLTLNISVWFTYWVMRWDWFSFCRTLCV